MRLYPGSHYPQGMNETARGGGHPSITIDQPGIYRIKIQGRLGPRIQARFDELNVAEETNPDGLPFTTISGRITDQAALHGLLARIRDLGLPLILIELVRQIDN